MMWCFLIAMCFMVTVVFRKMACSEQDWGGRGTAEQTIAKVHPDLRDGLLQGSGP